MRMLFDILEGVRVMTIPHASRTRRLLQYPPVYVAHGFTRRHTLAGLCIFGAFFAVVSGSIVTAAILPVVISEVLMRPSTDSGELLGGPSVLGSPTFLSLATVSLLLAIVLTVGALGVFRVLRSAAIK